MSDPQDGLWICLTSLFHSWSVLKSHLEAKSEPPTLPREQGVMSKCGWPCSSASSLCTVPVAAEEPHVALPSLFSVLGT